MKRCRSTIALGVLAVAIVALALATPVSAFTYPTFSVAYDGQTASVDGGTPSVITAGDGSGFQLNVHATGNAFWEVTAPLGDLTKWAGFNVAPFLGIMSTASAFYLDGVQVAASGDLNTQQEYYIGAVRLPAGTLPVGFRFDQVSVGVALLQGDPVTVGNDVLGGNPFFQNPAFTFNPNAAPPLAATPLPGALVLFSSVLAAWVCCVGARSERRQPESLRRLVAEETSGNGGLAGLCRAPCSLSGHGARAAQARGHSGARDSRIGDECEEQ